MELTSKKYTVLMGNEPLTLWIKNNELKSAKFLDKRVQLNLDSEAIKLIKDNPTRVVNGNNLTDNLNFTQAVSKMMSSQLELAISKNDTKTLSRFARSELIPENMKENFVQAINRPNGLRGVLSSAVNKTNAIVQNLAKKIDRFFDKVNDRVANKKLDPYLSEFQLQHVNKAPPAKDLDLKKHLDPKLMELAEEFHKEKGLSKREFDPAFILGDKIILNDFLKQAIRRQFSLVDATTAFMKTDAASVSIANAHVIKSELRDSSKTIKDLESRLNVYEQKEAGKNETLKDFEVLSKFLKSDAKIDLLCENKEYLALSPQEQTKYEDLHIFQYENINDRLVEVYAVLKEYEKSEQQQAQPQAKETFIDRTPSIDFFDKSVQAKITQEWSKQQVINRESASPTRDFMNISAVRFGGVSETSLTKWAMTAKTHNQADPQIIDKFVSASLRNADELKKAGIFEEKTPGNFKFVDNFAKESLYKNLDKTVAQIAEANKGTVKEVSIDRDEIRERVQHMSSVESYKNMLTPSGELDSKKLYEFGQKLQSVATALLEKESPNVVVTREMLQKANLGTQQKAQSQGVENAR